MNSDTIKTEDQIKCLNQIIIYEAVKQYMNERLYLCGAVDESDIDEIHLFTLIIAHKLCNIYLLEDKDRKEREAAIENMCEDFIIANAAEFEKAFKKSVNKSVFAGISKRDLLAMSSIIFYKIRKTFNIEQ